MMRASQLAVVLLAWSPLTAHAQAPATEAILPPDADPVKEAYDDGNRLYDEGKLPEAEAAYERGWAIRETFDVAVQLGAVEVEQKKYREAAEHLSWAVAHMTATTGPEARKHIATRLATAREHVALLEPETRPRGAVVRVDGQELGRSPLEKPVFVDPGRHLVRAELEGYEPAEQAIEAAAQKDYPVVLELKRLGGEGPDESDHPWLSLRIVGFALGAAGIGAGVGLAVASNGKADEFESIGAELSAAGGATACDNPMFADRCAMRGELEEDRVGLANASVGLFVAGGVLVAATGAYWVVTESMSPGEAVAVVPVPGGLSVVGSF